MADDLVDIEEQLRRRAVRARRMDVWSVSGGLGLGILTVPVVVLASGQINLDAILAVATVTPGFVWLVLLSYFSFAAAYGCLVWSLALHQRRTFCEALIQELADRRRSGEGGDRAPG